MFNNYIKTAFRNLLRHKAYAMINILGLTIGITCSTLLYLYIQNELNFDKFHTKSDRIFRVVEIDKKSSGDNWFYGQTTPALAPALKAEFPEVSDFTRAFKRGGHIDIVWKEQRLHERNFFMVESNFFSVFDFKFTQGDKKALNDRNSMVLTASIAKKYFGQKNPIGELMDFAGYDGMKVTGVIEDLPENSHLQFDLVFSQNTAFEKWSEYLNDWSSYGAYTYLVLENPNQIKNIESKKAEFIKTHWGDKKVNDFYLQNLENIYLESDQVQYGVSDLHGNKFYIKLFIAIAIFILLIATINYMNLATAKTTHRAKEIGLRKVTGATRSSLAMQFLIEAILVAMISFVISLGLIEAILPIFNEISGKHFTFSVDSFLEIVGVLFFITILIGLVSGSYPAFYLSALKPIECFRGEVKNNFRSLFLREGLVVTQFAISIIMIVATIVVYSQLNFIREKPLGFDKVNMMVIDINNRNVRNNFQTMKSEFAAIPGVVAVASSSRVPGEWKNIRQTFVKTSKESSDSLDIYYMGFDEDMLSVYNINLLDGSNFEGNILTDSTKVMINKAAADALGFENPIGKTISILRMGVPVKIIGVLENFHYQSLHNDVAPLIVGCWANNLQAVDYFTLKISNANLKNVIAEATKVHEKFDNNTPIEYHFLDSQLDLFYKKDQQAGNLFGIGAILMVFVASLGLFGLTSFMMEKRKKEIGVRKVLGASLGQLYILLTKTYAKQVLIAFLIATPFGWYMATEWLNYFAYQFTLTPMVFLCAGFISLLIALSTVTYRVFKASVVNPAETLKHE